MISNLFIEKAAPAVKYGLAGAVCTVIVAWLLAMFHTDHVAIHQNNRWAYKWANPLIHNNGVSGFWPADDQYCWLVEYYVHYIPGVQVIHAEYPTFDAKAVRDLNPSIRTASSLPSWSMASKPPNLPLIGSVIEQGTGFPFLAMYGARVFKGVEGASAYSIPRISPQLEWAIELPYEQPHEMLMIHRILPLKPIWRGFLLDTLVWGFVCYVIHILGKRIWKFVIIPFRIRANIAQGKCRKLRCGYPVTGFSKCPECGTVVKTKKTKNTQTL